MERAAGLRAAFFVYGRHKVRPEIHDCRSTVFNRKVDWNLLRSLAADGWEFGLHPPIRAKYDLEEFLIGKEILETRLGKPVYGLRHHYWALDWRKPYLTFRKHVTAGFRYDSSMAWKDDNGFRAGTCLPYQPFDPERQTALDIYELPTAMMDGHVIPGAVTLTLQWSARFVLPTGCGRVGGVLNLDWHTEAGTDRYCYYNQRTVLMRLVSALQARADAWFVTPWELIRYWQERRKSLSAEAESADAIRRVPRQNEGKTGATHPCCQTSVSNRKTEGSRRGASNEADRVRAGPAGGVRFTRISCIDSIVQCR